jgi:GNAT superfamily N-acetyltransferase
MASTEQGHEGVPAHGLVPAKAAAHASAVADAAHCRPLTPADLPAALQLSAAASWNQDEDDWRTMLRLGRGWGIDAIDAAGHEQLAASIVVLPYGERFAWTSMVLVLPEFRRRGYAQQMLRFALRHLASQGRAAVLDATPAGHAVYLQEGFRDTWGFARYRREATAPSPPSPSGPVTRALLKSDWPAIEALDSPAFGASRLALLRSLAQRLPQAARVVDQGGRLRGFVLGRNGREAQQIGPLLADDEATALSLLHAALVKASGPVYVDLLDNQRQLLPWLEQQGFALQRPFTRMVHGAPAAPGNAETIVLVAEYIGVDKPFDVKSTYTNEFLDRSIKMTR